MSDITVNNFKAFYEQIRPYLGSAHSGFTPIGTVISVMGTTAPLNYLACDGTAYNIADYPELAAYFNQQFGASNYFGGNGTTTFAVPDLRGEFLRGTGTNSHANQGSGAAVGVHQDGTEHLNIGYNGNENVMYIANSSGNGSSDYIINEDSQYKKSTVTNTGRRFVSDSSWASTSNNIYTSRPTNTSVLYCIASKNIFMDAGSNYSTEEQVVGTWIDGKPIYQKTVHLTSLNATWAEVAHNIVNINQVCSINGVVGDNTAMFATGGCVSNEYERVFFQITSTHVKCYVAGNNSLVNKPVCVTLRYTKTTD